MNNTAQKLVSETVPQLTMAEQADRHILYELSVQDAQNEIKFLTKTYKSLRFKKARSIREDFCGTANLCKHWVEHDKSFTAIGVDIDASVLDWGKQHHIAKLNDEQKSRVQMIEGDVLTTETEKVDINVAMNFSYWIFKTRDSLRTYFEQARKHIKDDGIFVLDCFGGSEAFEELKEKTKHKKHGFTYVWHQASYNPINGDYKCHIHFKFKDGSKMKKAFTYEWRLWTLPEIQELLKEAGFNKVNVYWEEEDNDGEGTGVYKPETKGLADAGWIAYIVAEN